MRKNLRVFDYKIERRKKEEHEDCWPLLNTTGGSPGTKRNAILETPAETSVNGNGGQTEYNRHKKGKRQYTIDTEQQKQEKGESQAGRRNVPTTPPAREQKGGTRRKNGTG